MMVAEVLRRKTRDTSAHEIELWVKHVGPYVGDPTMANKLIDFYRALEAEGIEEGVLDNFTKFAMGDDA